MRVRSQARAIVRGGERVSGLREGIFVGFIGTIRQGGEVAAERGVRGCVHRVAAPSLVGIPARQGGGEVPPVERIGICMNDTLQATAGRHCDMPV